MRIHVYIVNFSLLQYGQKYMQLCIRSKSKKKSAFFLVNPLLFDFKNQVGMHAPSFFYLKIRHESQMV